MGCVPDSAKHNTEHKNSNCDERYSSPRPVPRTAVPTSGSTKKVGSKWDPNSNYCCIRQKYKILNVIGHGKFGVVYKAESKINPGQLFAIKVIKSNSYLDLRAITEEIKILRALDHPNIVKFYEEIEDGPYFFIVTEYCSGGELFDRIAKKRTFGESEAANIIEKILCALSHCHSKNIAHRDIKPENILYTTADDLADVKLIDFGLAKQKTDAYTYQTIVGSPCYLAPEVIEGNYTNSCDMWSLGVVLHLLLSGKMPFDGKTIDDIFRSIKKGLLNFTDPVWNKVTPPGRDLVQKLLEPDENKRLTAEQALKHDWFKLVKEYPPEIDELDSVIMKSLKKYQGTSRFQQACMGIFVKHLQEEELSCLAEGFRNFDKERNGFVHVADLISVFQKQYPKMDMKELLGHLETDGQNIINYTQFLASMLDVKQFLTKERLWALFQSFDIANNGYLTAEEIMTVFNKNNSQQYDISQVRSMLKEHNIKNTDNVKFNEFEEIMNKMKVPLEEEVFE